MAEQSQQSAKGQVLNDRTYQEVEYLKKNLGPILVAALAEICIRRPGDPIEYLGHWLLRWRYNEELKRRDVQNALEVVRQKAWAKDDEGQAPPAGGIPNFSEGFAAAAAAAAAVAPEAARKSEPPPAAAAAAGVEDSGERRASGGGEEKRLSGQQEARGSTGEARRASGGEEGRRTSEGAEKRASAGEPPAAAGGEEPEASNEPPQESYGEEAPPEVAVDEPPPAPEEAVAAAE